MLTDSQEQMLGILEERILRILIVAGYPWTAQRYELNILHQQLADSQKDALCAPVTKLSDEEILRIREEYGLSEEMYGFVRISFDDYIATARASLEKQNEL